MALLLGLLAAASAGSAGPGRFANVGPDPLVVGLAAGAEFFVAIGLGLAVGQRFAPAASASASRDARTIVAHERHAPQKGPPR